jgi:hypothetical protein
MGKRTTAVAMLAIARRTSSSAPREIRVSNPEPRM